MYEALPPFPLRLFGAFLRLRDNYIYGISVSAEVRQNFEIRLISFQ